VNSSALLLSKSHLLITAIQYFWIANYTAQNLVRMCATTLIRVIILLIQCLSLFFFLFFFFFFFFTKMGEGPPVLEMITIIGYLSDWYLFPPSQLGRNYFDKGLVRTMSHLCLLFVQRWVVEARFQKGFQ
jgi:hypothetical protein